MRSETELYLGLAYGFDLEETRKRTEAAKKVATQFGIATECAMGRALKDEFENVMEGLVAVS